MQVDASSTVSANQVAFSPAAPHHCYCRFVDVTEQSLKKPTTPKTKESGVTSDSLTTPSHTSAVVIYCEYAEAFQRVTLWSSPPEVLIVIVCRPSDQPRFPSWTQYCIQPCRTALSYCNLGSTCCTNGSNHCTATPVTTAEALLRPY